MENARKNPAAAGQGGQILCGIAHPLSGAGYKFYKGGDTVTMKDVPVSTNGVAKIQAMVPDLYVVPVRDAIKKYYGITTTTPDN